MIRGCLRFVLLLPHLAMTKAPTMFLALLLSITVVGCHRESRRVVALKDGASLVCEPPRTLTLRSLPDGRYGLLAATVDSAQLGRILHTVLPPTPGPRVLIVDVAPERTRDIQWIVPLVEAEGYAAYKPDPACDNAKSGAPFVASSR